ncbi:Maf1 regulator [Neoconidiobolus thromboides FSU 785]|nr:Maf1 regulator [Neoconidiobolus thromboides FSU 785]
MKFLESVDLEYLNQALTFETSDCKVIGRIEPYSCKQTIGDKKLFKRLEIQYVEENSKKKRNFKYKFKEDGHELELKNEIESEIEMEDNSPMNSFNGSTISPFGPINLQSSRKTFFYLISTLNETFPDYDFSRLKHDQFIKTESLQMVMNSINYTLISAGAQSILNQINLWDHIDFMIQLKDADIYSYVPDLDTDPFAEHGCIWSFNYFFFNKKLKRIIYFTCRGVR